MKITHRALPDALSRSRWLLLLASLGGCAVPGIFWTPTPYQGPVISGAGRAHVFSKCDMGPSGLSDVTACHWAFEDHRGRKVDVSDDIQAPLDGFMPTVDRLRPWVKVEQAHGLPSAPSGRPLPYRLHLLTISPTVLLAVPAAPGESELGECAGTWQKDGCIPSRRFDLAHYVYLRPPKVTQGAFWMIPALHDVSGPVTDTGHEVVIELPDAVLRLTPVNGTWQVTRANR